MRGVTQKRMARDLATQAQDLPRRQVPVLDERCMQKAFLVWQRPFTDSNQVIEQHLQLLYHSLELVNVMLTVAIYEHAFLLQAWLPTGRMGIVETGLWPAKASASGRCLYDAGLRDAVLTSASISEPSKVPLRTSAFASANSSTL